ncbi:MAG: tRNA (adenosine(37)-N6)-threonylcarbamoyltransferase complex ATPase subunit type 1 TsaE, partial [Gammaproteobacteria bacterium]|nr:tRNA (adenosine(37)-N6)-threonylcarbamoyltransferase complex ATPase subunit type 1 TsaE [Gammaproteobacteria bacterium]
AHFDLYRLGDPEELEYLGYRDYLRSDTWCFIEWPERAAGYLENIGLEISIQYQHECRKLEGSAGNSWGAQLKTAIDLI